MKEEITLNIKLPPMALKLRELRLTKGLSLYAVAKACNILFKDLYSYETGKAEPPEETLERLIDFYT